MGREAKCHCTWGKQAADCKVLLENGELIVRLGMQRRVSLTEITDVSVRSENLVFNVGRDHVELHLGNGAAERWAKAILTPEPTLASKLGISSETRLWVVGQLQSEELKAAIAEAGVLGKREANLILICVQAQAELTRYFEKATPTVPFWVVYPKGARSEIKESDVRDFFRNRGYVDTKVASVSSDFTALRFNQPKE
jgi:hypothetical protein